MGFIPHTCIFLLTLVVFSCGSSGEQTAEKNLNDSTNQQSSANQDSMPTPEPVLPPPSPGTARVKGEIVEIDSAKNKNLVIIKFKVLQTLEYGSSTPAIAGQDTLELSASSNQENLTKGKKFIIVIQHQEQLIGFGKPGPQWQIVSIAKN